jgi:citrate synthase
MFKSSKVQRLKKVWRCGVISQGGRRFEMAQETTIKNTGLRGVTVADTKISFIDGEKGVLLYSGYRIEDLAAHSSFEETASLILKGKLPTSSELNNFRNKLVSHGFLPDFVIDSMRLWPDNTGPMQVLMAAISMLGFDDRESDNDLEAYEEKSARLISAMEQ